MPFGLAYDCDLLWYGSSGARVHERSRRFQISRLVLIRPQHWFWVQPILRRQDNVSPCVSCIPFDSLREKRSIVHLRLITFSAQFHASSNRTHYRKCATPTYNFKTIYTPNLLISSAPRWLTYQSITNSSPIDSSRGCQSSLNF